MTAIVGLHGETPDQIIDGLVEQYKGGGLQAIVLAGIDADGHLVTAISQMPVDQIAFLARLFQRKVDEVLFDEVEP